MAKYHMSAKGNPEACSATVRACPLGDAEEHYPTQKAAREAYEAKNSATQVAPSVQKVGVRLQNRASKFSVKRTLKEVPKNPTTEELKNASAYSVVNKQFIAAGYKSEKYNEAFEDIEDSDYDTDYAKIQAKEYLVSAPDGSFTKVVYVASVEAQDDGVLKFYPELEATYRYYPNLESLESNKDVKTEEVKIDTESVFYESDAYGTKPSYDYYDDKSTRQVAESAIEKLPKPFEIARLAMLQESTAKIPENTLLSEKYFGNKDDLIRASVVEKDEFPIPSHEKALNDKSGLVQNALARRGDLSKEHMEKILELDQDYRESIMGVSHGSPRQHLLRNPKLPIRTMNKIAKEGSVNDLKALYKNPSRTDKVKTIIEERGRALGLQLF